MQKLKSMFAGNAEKATAAFRNGCIAVVGSGVAASPAFATLIDSDTTAALAGAQTDGESVGKIIIAAVAVIVGVSLIISMMRKA